MVDVEFKIISIGEIKEAQMVRKNISNINRIIRLKIFSLGSVIWPFFFQHGSRKSD